MGCGAIKTQDQTTAHSANCFVVACMDFRLVDDVTHFMDKIGHNNNYDQFVLAGASLGFTQDKYPEWGKSLLDHMSIGQSLHNFRFVVSYLDKSSLLTTETVGHIKNFIRISMPKINNSFMKNIYNWQEISLLKFSLLLNSGPF